MAILVQGPLGWWVVRRLGTDRLLRAWGWGLAARAATFALVALLAPRLLGRPPGPVLICLAALLLILLLVEGFVAMLAAGSGAQ